MSKKDDNVYISRQGAILHDGADPSHPHGENGKAMLDMMNEHHYELTGWGLSHIRFTDNDNILDIGCGGGMTVKRLADGYPGARITGVDYSKTSIEKSMELNKEGIEERKLYFVHASVEDLPFSDNKFDKITTVESFYFWPDPQENLKEVCRVLKPGGKFLLIAEVYDNGNISEQQQENIDKYRLFNPTPEEFKRLFENAGFININLHFKEGEEWICVTATKPSTRRHSLYQIALFQSVALGDFYGVTTAGRIKKHGDFGMGIFESVNGEMIMLDGVVYQALHDGSVVVASEDALIPYCDVTFFEADHVVEDFSADGYLDLEKKLTQITDELGKNMIYYVKISGHFKSISVRSELKQKEPYKMLNIALRTDQRRYDYEELDGTIIALYCPAYFAAMNAPGWHFHFISDDGLKGGHMLGAKMQGVKAEFDRITNFDLDIPNNEIFNALDLSKDLSEAIKEAERGE